MSKPSVTYEELPECAICLDECLNPVRLECTHVFCYLCVKGSALQSNNRCPVCRHPIASNYFENPNLIESIDWKDVPEVVPTREQWQYEGRNGWWLYDCRTSRDIEKAFGANEETFEVLIAGFVYVIDFQRMIQFRRNEPNRIRRIRRQPLDPTTTKGVAGLRTTFNDVQQQTDSSLPNDSNGSQSEDNSEDMVQPNDESIETNETDFVSNNALNTNPNTSEGNEETDNGEDITHSNEGIVQLGQALNTSLTLRDSRETYL